MSKSFHPQQYFWTLLITLLVACEATSPQSTPVPASTPTNLIASQTPVLSTPTSPPTTATATPSLQTATAPDGLRMAYVIDGDLYLQDGNNPPSQLTDSGEDRQPTFSEDGKKIVFLRGFIPHDLYSLNADGNQEQVVISGEKMSALAAGYSELSEFRDFAFVPGTHLVVFNTRELGEADVANQDWNRTSSKDNHDLLIVDTNTGEITSLLSPGKGGNFLVSPDGKAIAVQARGHVDIVSIDGQMIRQDLITYVPTQPYELEPGIFWTADSTELIVTLPVGSEYNMDGPETRSVWRYALTGSAPVQISLDPPPISSDYSVSPDGNWILYTYYHYPGKTDETVRPGLYLGNLRTGGAAFYSPDVIVPTWSSDSTHFIYEGLFLGTVDGPLQHIGEGGFLGWSDADHFLYTFNGMIVMGDTGGSTRSFPTSIPDTSIAARPYFFNFIVLNR